MNLLIHHATACIMLLHALLGCCVHHDHCCAGDAGSVAVHGVPVDGVPADGVPVDGVPVGHDEGSARCAHGTAQTSCGHGHAGHPPSAAGPTSDVGGTSDFWIAKPGSEDHSGSRSPAHQREHRCESGDCVFVWNAGFELVLDMTCHWLDASRRVESEQAAAAREFGFREPDHRSPPRAERLQAEYCIWLI